MSNVYDQVKAVKAFLDTNASVKITANSQDTWVRINGAADTPKQIKLRDRIELLGAHPTITTDGNTTLAKIEKPVFQRFFGPASEGPFPPLFRQYPDIVRTTEDQKAKIHDITGNPVIAVMNIGNLKAITLAGSIDGVAARINHAVTTSAFQAFNKACSALGDDDKDNLISRIRDMRECVSPEQSEAIVKKISKEHGPEIADAFEDVVDQMIGSAVKSKQHRPSYGYGIIKMDNEDFKRVFGV